MKQAQRKHDRAQYRTGKLPHWNRILRSIGLNKGSGTKNKAQKSLKFAVLNGVTQRREFANPSLVLGDDVLRWLIMDGWGIDEASWLRGEEPVVQPDISNNQLAWKNREDLQEAGDATQSELAAEMEQEWSALVDKAQRDAGETTGDEAGALLSHEECAPSEAVLREAWKGLATMRDDANLASGPPYTEPGDNPEEFKGRKTPFVPGGVHKKVAAWRKMDPPPDREVLAWIEKGYEVKAPPEGEGIRSRNGRLARENMGALQALLIKRLKEKSWEATESVTNIIPANLTPKEGAAIPWRLVLNAKLLNSSFNTWRTRYEGLKTVPLTVKPDDWLFSIDLESGYDAMLMQEKSRGLFGVKVRLTAEQVQELLEMELLKEVQAQFKYEDGSWEVLLRPRTLVQGWVNSCGVFTKLVRQVVRMWRKRGYRLVSMLDDSLFAVSGTYEEAVAVRDRVLKDLEELGFCVSWLKSVLTPCKCLKFLGMLVDSLSA